jgi:hypothetical protein
MYEPGDCLLFAISAWRTTPWNGFKKAFDEIHEHSIKQGSALPIEAARQIRARALRVLVSLAHCDVDFSGYGKVIVAPPSMIALPQAGLPRAVLCGARSPATIVELERLRRQHKKNIKIVIQRQTGRAAYAPACIEIQGSRVEDLHRFAQDARIPFFDKPASWSLVTAVSPLSSYLAQLRWTSQTEPNWEREDFSVEHLSFGREHQSGSLRLSRFRDPVRSTWQYYLARDGSSAPADLDWARYSVLQDSRRRTIFYDCDRGYVAVPRSVPLPHVLARTLVLCSGRGPAFAQASDIHSKDPVSGGFDLFESVPPDVICHVVKILGQDAYEMLSFAGGKR